MRKIGLWLTFAGLSTTAVAATATAINPNENDPFSLVPEPYRSYLTSIAGLGMFFYVVWRILLRYGISRVERQITEPPRKVGGDYEYSNLFTTVSGTNERVQLMDEEMAELRKRLYKVEQKMNRLHTPGPPDDEDGG